MFTLPQCRRQDRTKSEVTDNSLSDHRTGVRSLKSDFTKKTNHVGR